MIRTLLLAALSVLLAGQARAQSPASPASSSSESPPPELIVRLAADTSPDLRRQLRGTLSKSDSPLFEGVRASAPVFAGESRAKAGEGPPLEAYTLAVQDSAALARLRDRWEASSSVRYVQENTTFQLERRSPLRPGKGAAFPETSRTNGSASPARPLLNLLADSLDHLDVVRARDGWEVTRGNPSVRIGIVDSGIYTDHPDLQGSLAVNAAEDRNGNGRLDAGDRNGIDDDGNGVVDDVAGYDFVDRPDFFLAGEYQDRDPDASPDPEGSFSGHGTTVAGVAVARAADSTSGIDGVAPEATFVPLRAFAGDGRGQTDDIAAAIVYAAENDLDVLNLSFGRSRPAPLLEEAIQYALERGLVVVASAGNDLTDEPHYPSDYPGVISVVWLAEDGRGLPQFNRSQFGIGVDIGAPGSNVFTTRFPSDALREGETPTTDDLYGNATGSSFSAPQVAGAAALLRSRRPDLTPASVRSILTTEAADLEEENWDHTTGSGRLDVAASLLKTLPGNTELVAPAHNAGTDASAALPVVGTALHPNFASYSVSYAEGTTDLDRGDPWVSLTEPREQQVRRDTLARWDVTQLRDGAYTLRLTTTLTDGRTVEDRRRVVVDRTAPSITPRFLGAGRIDGRWGVVGDLEMDDRSRVSMRVRLAGAERTVDSEFVAKRQGLTLPDRTGDGGTAQVRIRARNRAGLSTTLDTTVSVPASAENTGTFERTTTSVPRGRLLPQTVDFDRDAAAEIVLNQFEGRGISDTLRSFEWTPGGFAPADTLIANVIPKDVGDPDGNGRQNLLTQVTAVTLLLEQETPTSFPKEQAFVDTTGLRNPSDEEALIGTQLTDLDDDGRGEIVGNNQRQWRVLEWTGSGYEERLRLENPTSPATIDSAQNANRFGTAAAARGDFDADGRPDLLVGDRDGDWIVYEGKGNNDIRPTWTFETRRFDAGNRFGTADWDGDGVPEFVTFNTYYPLPLEPGEFEPPLGFYHVWDAAGEDTYERAFRLPIAGESSGQGSIGAADFDGDGRDEIVLVHPPGLSVLDYRPGAGWRVVFHDADDPPVFGRSVVAADVDGNGVPELVAATEGETLALYRVRAAALASAPPRWRAARPTGADGVRLSWRAPGADSVTVYAGVPDAALNPVRTQADSSLDLSSTSVRRYALKAWRDGTASPFSAARRVRPHPPAQVSEVSYPAPASVRLQFSAPLADNVRAEQFRLNETIRPSRALIGGQATAVLLRFEPDGLPPRGTLTWSPLRDTSGLAVGPSSVEVAFPDRADRRLVVETVEFPEAQTVRLRFNEALHPPAARDRSRYRVRPRGEVASVSFSPETPRTVTLRLSGIVVGATGISSSLEITAMEGADGRPLAANSGAVQLNRPASGLDDVFVHPNPHRAQRHDSHLTIAGLPTEATVRIFAASGQLVRVLEVARNRSGGRRWNLENERGETVPPGVYLIRVEAPGADPVLRKTAIIR